MPQRLARRRYAVTKECFKCQASTLFWTDYFCPRCGWFHWRLYAEESAPPRKQVDPLKAELEYAAAGIPFAHNPNYLSGEEALALLRGEPRGYEPRK